MGIGGGQHGTGPGRAASREQARQAALVRMVALAVSGALLTAAEPTLGPGAVAWWLVLLLLALTVSGVHLVRARGAARTSELVLEAVATGAFVAVAYPQAPVLAVALLVPGVLGSVQRPYARLLPLLAGLAPIVFLLLSTLSTGTPPSLGQALWLPLAIGICVVAAWRTRAEQDRIEGAQAYERALALLRQLAPISRRLPVGLDQHALLEQCARDVAADLPGSDVTIYLWDGGDWTLGFGSPMVSATAISRGSPLWDAVVLRGRTYVHQPDGDRSASYLAVPVRRDGALRGMLLVRSPDGPFGRRSIGRFGGRASLLALQLEAATVFGHIREGAISEERSRVSRQIHDGVAQDLAALAYSLDGTALSLPEDQRDVIEAAAAEVRRLVDELRFSIHDLRVEAPEPQRLGTALAQYAREVGDRSGLRVSVEIDDRDGEVPAGIAHEVMRIAQEAITNARRHSQASALHVALRVLPDGAVLRVADNGRGLDLGGRPSAGEGVGLAIMRERAERIGAQLSVRDSATGGTELECRVLWNARWTAAVAAREDGSVLTPVSMHRSPNEDNRHAVAVGGPSHGWDAA